MAISSLLVPILLSVTALVGMGRKINVYDTLVDGAREGLSVSVKILPSLVGLLTAVYMFRASGAMDFLGELLAPVLELVGIPPETAALLFIRPVSGGGALAVGSDLMAQYGKGSPPWWFCPRRLSDWQPQ